MKKVIKTAFLLMMIMVNTAMCMGNTGEKAKQNITSFFENTDSLKVTNPLISESKRTNSQGESICIDPGHQRKGNNGKEEIATGFEYYQAESFVGNFRNCNKKRRVCTYS